VEKSSLNMRLIAWNQIKFKFAIDPPIFLVLPGHQWLALPLFLFEFLIVHCPQRMRTLYFQSYFVEAPIVDISWTPRFQQGMINCQSRVCFLVVPYYLFQLFYFNGSLRYMPLGLFYQLFQNLPMKAIERRKHCNLIKLFVRKIDVSAHIRLI